MKFRVIVVDPPWMFEDALSGMKDGVDRSAASKYPTLDLDAIKALPVREISEDDAVLGLWCPSSMLQDGIDVMKAWGFRQVQEWIWVKLTHKPEDDVVVRPNGRVNVSLRAIDRARAAAPKSAKVQLDDEYSVGFSLPLAFGMGRLARASKETFLVGVRGSPYKRLMNRSTRDVFFAPAGRHSAKPECIQDALDQMFPQGDRLEMFARRARPGWLCVGNESPTTPGEDIRETLRRLTWVEADHG